MNKTLIQSAKTGLWVAVTVLVLNFILSQIGYAPRELFGITPATGITTTIGSKAIEIMQNLVSFNLESIIYLILSAIVIVYLGTLAIAWLKLPDGKTAWQKLALTLFYGTVPFYLLFVGIGKLPAIGTLIGLGLWYAGVAIVLGFLQNLKVKIL